jgi:hypothetical protein
MRPEDIAEVKLDLAHATRASERMLPGQIPGATVYHHVMMSGDVVQFMADPGFLRILFLCQGEVVFVLGGKEWRYGQKAVFVPLPEQTVDVRVEQTAHVLEVRWELIEADRQELGEKTDQFPVTARYVDAMQYRDPFKSEKTISRAIIPHRLLPRFAMGSVETYADDLIGQHEHPLLDQFFFSLPENRMTLLIDDIKYPMGPDTLLHIPLGSNHGVSVTGGEVAHYIWIDFIPDPEKGNAYLDEVHKPTGTTRSF